MERDHTQSAPPQDVVQLLEAVHINTTHTRAAEERIAAALEKTPDYSLTLSEVLGGQRAAANGIERLEKSPFLRFSPEALTKFLIEASATIRAEDRAALQEYGDAMARSIGQIDGVVERGRSVEAQMRQLIGISAAGFIMGILFWSIFPGAIARSLPARWHVPEWMAARTMGMDERHAGERLLSIAGQPHARGAPAQSR